MAKESITVELSDLEQFDRNLEQLNRSLKQIFYFQHVDEQLQIKFEPQLTGTISVTGFLKDKRYLNNLSFSFEMANQEISHLIPEVKHVISGLKR